MNLIEEVEFFSEIHIDENKIEDEEEKEVYRLYNNAISYIKYNSEDIAMICLKKAVSYNSEFLEAYNLMTAINISKKEYEEAMKCINKVLEEDSSNSKASQYLEIINIEHPEILQQVGDGLKKSKLKKGDRKQKKSNDITHKKNVKNETNKTKRTNNINTKVISYPLFMLGIIMIVIGVVAYKIDNLDSNKHNNYVVKTKYALNKEKNKNETQKRHKKYNKKNINESNNNKDENKNNSNNVQPQNNLTPQQTINNAAQLIAKSDFNGSADQLLKVDKSKLNYEQAKQYSQLIEKIYSETAEDNYNTGANYYRTNNYTQAVVYLQRYALTGKNDDYRRYALYYLVRSYLMLGDKQKAIQVYGKLSQEYPNAELTIYADKWINNNW